MNRYGPNILAQTVRDRSLLGSILRNLRPKALLVMDDPDYALAIKQELPDTTVIHRTYHKDDNDWHNKVSPLDWLNMHRPHFRPGVVTQVFNEPQGYVNLRPLAAWCEQLMRLASADRVRLALPNFGMWHPDTSRVSAGELDELFSGFMRHPVRLPGGEIVRHVLASHEYATNSMTAEYPATIGRITFSLARMARLGIPTESVEVVITEHGRDEHGKPGPQGDGWRIRMSPEQYVDFIMEGKAFYDSIDAGVCIYCYGIGGNGDWQTFDTEYVTDPRGHEIFWAAIAKRGKIEAEEKKPMVYQWAKVTPNGNWSVNIRPTPNTKHAPIGRIEPPFAILEVGPLSNGWFPVKFGSQQGFVSANVVAITPINAAPSSDGAPNFPSSVVEASNWREEFKRMEVAATELAQAAKAVQRFLSDWIDRNANP